MARKLGESVGGKKKKGIHETRRSLGLSGNAQRRASGSARCPYASRYYKCHQEARGNGGCVAGESCVKVGIGSICQGAGVVHMTERGKPHVV